MLSSTETPPSRPLPPAKARRATMLKSSTPPPAYNSSFTFPSLQQSGQDVLSPTLHMIGWDSDPVPSSSSPPELLVTVDERGHGPFFRIEVDDDLPLFFSEFDFGPESTMCKKQNPSQVSSSPTSSSDGPAYMMPRTMNYSTSDSALSVITSPHPSLLRQLDRKVTADISLLADQNVELMDKLEKLAAGTSSADQTGRRELKRLEKEIAILRHALEKTQAKGEELEEKVHGAVAGEAWRRKQEREAKFRAMRYSGRYTDRQEGESKVENFAPDGSMFGGPSERFSFFPAATSPNPRHTRQIQESNSDMELSGLFPRSQHTLISQLLVKVQELEKANAQILKQQNETATQLSAVQRDTEHITKAYGSWADPEAQIESDALGRRELRSSTEAVKFRSIGRNAVAQSSEGQESFVPRDFILAAKDRKSVMGLFPHGYPLVTDSPPNIHNLRLPSHPSSPSCSESIQDHLSLSSTGSRGLESPGALSPLHFFSPATQVLQELSPLGSRPTLQSELSKEFGDSWDMSPGAHHGRTSDLCDPSQFSVPPTPSPASRAMSRRPSDELNFEGGLCTSVPMTVSLLRLSVEPPTPVKAEDIGEYVKSPRVERMSKTLQSRTGRWVDRRFQEGRQNAKATSVQLNRSGSTPAEPTSLPQLLTNAIDKMIEKFDGLSDVDNEPKPDATSPSLPDHNALQLHVTSTPSRKETPMKTNVLSNLLLEVWLWFQFAIIIFVFIYAMAKRGPKAMLADSERKRPIAGSSGG
jgi:hypothetical protein